MQGRGGEGEIFVDITTVLADPELVEFQLMLVSIFSILFDLLLIQAAFYLLSKHFIFICRL